MVLFVPWWSNGAAAPRWALLSIGIPVALALWANAPRTNVADLLGLLLVAWSAVSLCWTPQAWDGIDALWKLLLLAGAYAIGRSDWPLTPIYTGAALGAAVNSFLLQFNIPGTGGHAAATFFNANHLAMAAVLVLLAAPRWWLIPGILPSVIAPESRGAFLGLAAGFAMYLPLRPRMAAFALMLVAIPGLIALRPDSVIERWNIWQDTVNDLHWLGHGLGAFWTDFPANAVHQDLMRSRPSHAHNDFLEMTYETGIVGIGLFAAMVALAVRARSSSERSVLVAVLAMAFVDWPLHLPVTAAFAALALGRLCRGGVHVRDLVAYGRICLRAWLARRDRSGWAFLAAVRRADLSARPGKEDRPSSVSRRSALG